MIVTPAFAQASGGGGNALLMQLPFFILIFAIFYLLLIRPQRKKMKEHQAMVEALRRGDQVITQGGVVGKLTKVREDGEVEIEIAEGVNVREIKNTIQTVLSKTEPAN